MPKVSDGR
jgi:NADH dehydrogenase (ubiquinone) flavoprotein 1